MVRNFIFLFKKIRKLRGAYKHQLEKIGDFYGGPYKQHFKNRKFDVSLLENFGKTCSSFFQKVSIFFKIHLWGQFLAKNKVCFFFGKIENFKGPISKKNLATKHKKTTFFPKFFPQFVFQEEMFDDIEPEI